MKSSIKGQQPIQYATQKGGSYRGNEAWNLCPNEKEQVG